MTDPYLGYIVGAYVVAAVVLAAMIGAIFLDRRSLLKKLKALSDRLAVDEQGGREP